MTKLCDHLAESQYVQNKDLFLDGFSYFTAQERRVLAVFLQQAHSVTVTLMGEPDSREEIFDPGTPPGSGAAGVLRLPAGDFFLPE